MPLPSPGDPFPAFTLPDQRGRAVTLKSLLGSPLVIYCYPEADTPLCTKQACALNEALPALARLNARVVGLSPDSPEALAAFAAKFKLKFTLLGDARNRAGTPPFLSKIGVWREKNMYGNKVMGIVRTTFVLDAKGVVAHRFDFVKVPTHAARVAKVLAEMQGQ
ncbi:MAG: peroxiredoxin [Phycisphaerales bacterium]